MQDMLLSMVHTLASVITCPASLTRSWCKLTRLRTCCPLAAGEDDTGCWLAWLEQGHYGLCMKALRRCAEGLCLGYFCTLAGYPLVPAQIAAVCWLAVPGLQAWALAVQASIGQVGHTAHSNGLPRR